MPETKDYYLGARFTKREQEKIKEFAKNRDLSISDLLREAVFSHMEFLKDIVNPNDKFIEKIEVYLIDESK